MTVLRPGAAAAARAIDADLLVLSARRRAAAARPTRWRQLLKVPLNEDGFFLEAHMKLRPVDFATEGVFVAGLAHSPKPIDENHHPGAGARRRGRPRSSPSDRSRSAASISMVDQTSARPA